MNFLSIILSIAVAAYVAIPSFLAPKLGTITLTELSNTIGTFRTNVNTELLELDQDLRFTTTTDPGHKHSTSTLTGVFGASQGGIATTTAPSNGQFLGASSSVPTWKTLTASGTLDISHTATSVIIGASSFSEASSYTLTGSNTYSGTSTFTGNVNIANTSTSISSTNLNISSTSTFNGTSTFTGGVSGTGLANFIGWRKIGETVLASANNAVTVSGLPAARVLRVYFTAFSPSASQSILVQFNGDGGANYSSRGSYNGGADATAGSETSITLSPGTATATSTFIDASISNYTNSGKVLMGSAIQLSTNAAFIPNRWGLGGQWATTTQISSINFTLTGGATFAASSTAIVYGSND